MPLDPFAIGSSRTIPLVVTGPDGVTPSGSFLAGDRLAASVWGGDDRAAVASPAAAWTDALAAAYEVRFIPWDTAALGPGIYRIRATATRGTDTVEILRDSFELLAVAAAGVAAPVYCTMRDLETYCSWVGQYLNTDADQTGFVEQRAAARQWMDSLILRAVPVAGGLNLVSRQNYWTWTSNAGTGYYGTGLAVDQVIKGYLDAGALVLTGPVGAKVIRACACYALALIFGAQPDASARKDAGRYMLMAQNEASTLVVELDTDGNGVSEYAFTLGSTNTRSG